MKIYLCGPIRDVQRSEASSWRDRASELLKKCGHETVNPEKENPLVEVHLTPDTVLTDEQTKSLVDFDKREIDSCDVLLVNLSNDAKTAGTPMEMIYAWERGKRIVVVGDRSKLSPWYRYHADRILPDLESALSAVIGGERHGGNI